MQDSLQEVSRAGSTKVTMPKKSKSDLATFVSFKNGGPGRNLAGKKRRHRADLLARLDLRLDIGYRGGPSIDSRVFN